MRYEAYQIAMSTAETARATINQQMSIHPELFPAEMQAGYKLNGWTQPSQKMPEVRLRRIRLQEPNAIGQKLAYTIAPCNLLPYLTGTIEEVEHALFLHQFGVPVWALTHVFGRNDSYWYRQLASFGRTNIVGTTVKEADKMPVDLLADEKHAKAHGEKWYIATTVAQDCVLGASVSATADAEGLTDAYGIFKQEAQQLVPDYTPSTVNIDGWAATAKAWRSSFPTVTIMLCFLHAFIKIRQCCKRLDSHYEEIKQQVWDIYHASDRSHFLEQIASLQAWLLSHRSDLTSSAVAAIDKLCQRADQYGLAYEHPTAYRTSNMLDRHMEPMARWLAGGRYFHGHLQVAELRSRSWAVLHNFRPYCPRATVSKTFSSPAHQLNGFVYRENWLENLLVSSSCQQFRHRHKKR